MYKNWFVGGAIDDFSKSKAKIPYVATVELSGTNGDGYVVAYNICVYSWNAIKQ